MDAQLRSSDQLEHVQTFLIRTGINYKLKNNLIATAGYAFISNRRVVENISGMPIENRLWEQLMVNHNLGFLPVQQRFRLEQRFLPISELSGSELKTTGTSFSNRFRYFTRALLPFSGEKNFSKGVFGALQNEVFLNFGDKGPVNGKTFDQNRLYLAVGYRIKSNLDLETGYMNQYISGRNKAFANNHIWQLAVYLR